jgi:hypothetical protein
MCRLLRLFSSSLCALALASSVIASRDDFELVTPSALDMSATDLQASFDINDASRSSRSTGRRQMSTLLNAPCVPKCRATADWQVQRSHLIGPLRRKGYWLVDTGKKKCRVLHIAERAGLCSLFSSCRVGRSGRFKIKCEGVVDCDNTPEPTPALDVSDRMISDESMTLLQSSVIPALSRRVWWQKVEKKCASSCNIKISKCQKVYKTCRCKRHY